MPIVLPPTTSSFVMLLAKGYPDKDVHPIQHQQWRKKTLKMRTQKLTIQQKVETAMQGKENCIFRRREIIDFVLQMYPGTNKSSVIPSDYLLFPRVSSGWLCVLEGKDSRPHTLNTASPLQENRERRIILLH
jgi:hypothetical protein